MIFYAVIFLFSIAYINYISAIPNVYLLILLAIILTIHWSVLYQTEKDNQFYIKQKSLESCFRPFIEQPFFRFSVGLLVCIFAIIIASYTKYNIEHERWLLSNLYHKDIYILATINSINNNNLLVKLNTVYLKNINKNNKKKHAHLQHSNSINNKEEKTNYININFDKIYLKLADNSKYTKLNINPTNNPSNSSISNSINNPSINFMRPSVEYCENMRGNNKKVIFKYGEKILFQAKLKPHYLFYNFVPDFMGASLYYQGLFTKTLSINSKDIIVLDKDFDTVLIDSLENISSKTRYGQLSCVPDKSFIGFSLRERIKTKFEKYSIVTPQFGIVTALIFGEKKFLSDSQIRAFQNTGTGHLIAISGMHISFVFILVSKVAGVLWPSRIYSNIKLSKPSFTYIVALIFSIFYGYISGFSMPTQRACTAIAIYTVYKIYKFKSSSIDIFALCLIVILSSDPVTIYSSSFWLSFGATAWLLYLYCNRFNFNSVIYTEKFSSINKDSSCANIKDSFLITFKDNIISCSVMFIALIPITILYFNKISVLSILANMLAIPVVSAIVLPLSFISLLLILIFNYDFGFLVLVDGILNNLIYYLECLNKFNLNLNYLYLDNFSLIIIFCILVLFLSPKGLPRATFIFTLIVIYLFNSYNKKITSYNNLIVDLLDVGQGLSIIVNTTNHQLLYDTGARIKGDYLAEKIVLNSLLAHKSKLDKIIISHWDHDHSGNLDNILRYLMPDYLYSSNPSRFKNLYNNQAGSLDLTKFIGLSRQVKRTTLDNLDSSGLTSKYIKSNINFLSKDCNTNYTWQWDNVKFRFFKTYPEGEYHGNNSSCILKIEYYNTGSINYNTKPVYTILLTGDIEAKTEQLLINQYGDLLKSDVLLVPHHGSKTSSSVNFIKQVAPKYALISVGNENIYRLPNNEIVNRYTDLGIKIFRTDNQGAIKLIFKDDRLQLKTIF